MNDRGLHESPYACPLCHASDILPRLSAAGGEYFDCQNCRLIHLHPSWHVSAEQERARYELHNNDPADERYTNFLCKAVLPLREKLRKGMRGLDYGAGLGPAIASMLSQYGVEVLNYDPYFAPTSPEEYAPFDFIVTTETVEHFNAPIKEFLRMRELLKPDGLLCIMTEIYEDTIPFADWWYLKDPTHVSLYRLKTFHWLAMQWGVQLERVHKNVVILGS